MSDVKLYAVRAKPTGRGWELHIPGVATITADELAGAHRLVRNYIMSRLDGTYAGFDVMIIPALGPLADDFQMALGALDDAKRRYADIVGELHRLGVSEQDALILTRWADSKDPADGGKRP
jgi:hypothetical protein